MRIAELYLSRQGEGQWAGQPSVFNRASGCNLRCWYCDTPFASWVPEGEDLSVEEILAQVEQVADGCRHVVITGGEPMLFAELVPLTQRLADAGWTITIETAGTLDLPVACHLMSISPKMSNSTPSAVHDSRWHVRHDRSRHVPAVIQRLTLDYPFQMKFVIDQPSDLDEMTAYLSSFPHIPRSSIYLMPLGTDPTDLSHRTSWLSPYCHTHGYHFCPRLQIEWYGFTRGT